MTKQSMISAPATNTLPDSPSRKMALQVLLLRVMGGLLVLYGLCWLALIGSYLQFVHHDLPGYADTVQANVAQFMHLPQIHVLQAVVYASPLPLLVCGWGCLNALAWARRAAVGFLALQWLGLALVIYLIVQGLHTESLAFQISARHGYFYAAAFLFVNGFLCEFLLRGRAVHRSNP